MEVTQKYCVPDWLLAASTSVSKIFELLTHFESDPIPGVCATARKPILRDKTPKLLGLLHHLDQDQELRTEEYNTIPQERTYYCTGSAGHRRRVSSARQLSSARQAVVVCC